MSLGSFQLAKNQISYSIFSEILLFKAQIGSGTGIPQGVQALSDPHPDPSGFFPQRAWVKVLRVSGVDRYRGGAQLYYTKMYL